MANKQQPKGDCFAFEQKSKTVDCACLKRLYCQEGKCNFYMSKEDYIKKNGETYERTIQKLEGYQKPCKSEENEE